MTFTDGGRGLFQGVGLEVKQRQGVMGRGEKRKQGRESGMRGLSIEILKRVYYFLLKLTAGICSINLALK